MGLFDGCDGLTESGSSAEMAKWLGAPAVLVVDAKSMARSAAALVYGFVHFDPGLKFAGVIFNRVSGEKHLRYLQEALSSSCPETAVLGGIPREEAVRIPERHLGLITADEMKLDSAWQHRLAALRGKTSRYRPAPGKDKVFHAEGGGTARPDLPARTTRDSQGRNGAGHRRRNRCGARRGLLFLLSRQPRTA